LIQDNQNKDFESISARKILAQINNRDAKLNQARTRRNWTKELKK